MARLWQLGVQAVRPGTYFRVSSGDVVAEGAINGIVAAVVQSNWGPLNTVIDISPEEQNNLSEIIGTGKGADVVRQAFIGGAQMVRAVRVGAGGRKVKFNLRSRDVTTTSTDEQGQTVTTTTPGPYAVRIYAKYPGARTFRVTINTHLIKSGWRQATFYDEQLRTLEVIDFKSGSNDATALVNAIKSNSQYFTATRFSATADKALKLKDVVQQKSFDGVNPTTTVGTYSEGCDVLERCKWNVIICDTNTQAVHDVLINYVRQSYQVGQLGMTVIGALKSKPLTGEDSRTAYAAACNDWRVVYLLNGWIGTDNKTYQGYLAAARIGGMIAGCETNASLTHIVIQDALKPLENLTNGQIINAEEHGCFVLSTNDYDQVWIDNSINTLITLGNDQDEGWKKVRRTKCRFELMTRVNRTCDKLVGRLNNDAHGRATVIAAMQSIINEMIGEGKLFTGSYAAENPVYKPVGDRAYFMLVIGDIDSLEKLYVNYNFSYANPFSELDVVESA